MRGWASVFRLRQRAKGSLLAVPVLGAAAGAVVAELCVRWDAVRPPPFGWTYSPTTAQEILTTIVGAMVSLFGFVVAIGVLVVQVATGSLSPRFMRLWYRDRLQKFVLATFVGTIVLAFSLLHRVGGEQVYDLGVTLAGVGVAVSLILLLWYLDRFVHTLRPVGIGRMVARQGVREARQVAALARRYHGAPAPGELPTGSPAGVVRSYTSGIVQSVDLHRLIALAERYDCVLVMTSTYGDFVATDAPLIEIHTRGGRTPDERVFAGRVALGDERTIDDDPGFAMRVLVDIAIRSLPPYANDPTTTVQLLDYIEMLLIALGRTADLGEQLVLRDRRGRVRLVVPMRGFNEYLQLAVTEIRQYGAASTQVCRRLTALLEGVRDAVLPEQRPLVEAELGKLERTVAASFTDPREAAFARRSDRQGLGGTAEPPEPPLAGRPG